MASINSVTIIGRMTRDIEPQKTKSGKDVCNFTLAVDGYNKEAAASFINCVAWGNLVGVLERYAGKGKQVGITGRLQSSTYEDKDSGKKRSKTEVVVDQLQLLGGGEKSNRDDNDDRSTTTKDVVIDDIDDKPIDLSEIPF